MILLFRKLKGTYRIRYIDDVVVKGKTEPVGVHEVLDYHKDQSFPNLMDVVNHFNEGRKKYKNGDFTNAIESFRECLKANSSDKLSETYIDRCQQLITSNPKDWDGVLGNEKQMRHLPFEKKIFLRFRILQTIGQRRNIY